MICPVKKPRGIEEGLGKAGEVIRSGGTVAFPTETFYGLGVNVTDERAIHHLIGIKERRDDHPILILIPCIETLKDYVTHVPETAFRLMDQFWPGGLTLVLDAALRVSSLLTADTGKIGVRLSGHPIATGLARAAGTAITGTSANVSGAPPCNRPEDVLKSLGGKVDLILDGGKTAGGRGSTVLDLTVDPPLVLREGIVSRERINAVLPCRSFPTGRRDFGPVRP